MDAAVFILPVAGIIVRVFEKQLRKYAIAILLAPIGLLKLHSIIFLVY